MTNSQRNLLRWALATGALFSVLPAAAQTAPLGGVYAPCSTYSATPQAHWQANRATRSIAGGVTRYYARGSNSQLTTTVTLAETGKQFFEVRSSCPLPASCTRSLIQPPSGLGLHCRFSVPGQGMRDYDMHVPNNYTNLTAFPLVMELHGGGGLAVPPLTETLSGWREVSDTSRAPFIVVWPVGSNEADGAYGEEWQTCNYDNSTAEKPCPAVGYPHDRNFVIEVLKKVVNDLKIDRRRIHATGLSSGAAMVHSLACKYSGYFATVAPMATGIKVQEQVRARDRFDLTVNCNPTREVPQFYVHSPHDPISEFAEGAASVSFWRSKFACSASSATSYASEVDLLDSTDLFYPAGFDLSVCRTTECGTSSNPSAVAFCEIDGSSDILNAQGHVVWLGDDFYFPVVQPLAPRLAQWAWDWMRQYALPANPAWPPPST